MPDAVAPLDVELLVVANPGAPEDLQFVGTQYWDVQGIDTYTDELIWTHRMSEIDFKRWSGTAYFAAAAGATASAPAFECSTCGGTLTLSSRQTLADARRGLNVQCRSCNATIEERAASVLDPDARARRERKAEQDRLESEAQAVERAAASDRAERAADLEAARREIIQAHYPSESEDDGGYAAIHASLEAKVATLAIVQAAGEPNGLIHPVRYDDASIAAGDELARELFRDALFADLLLIHPSSPANAFVWDETNPTRLTGSIYTDRVRFAAPGPGSLAGRLDRLSDHLRELLQLESLWSTDREALTRLSRRLVVAEAIRYFSYELALHDLPNAGEQHQERLRSHVQKAADSFALGHIYKMAWTSARDAISAYKRIGGMSREKATTHGVNKLVLYIQRGLDEPEALGNPYDERNDLPLSAATDVVFRVVLRLNPMRAMPLDVAARTAGSPDRELIRQCDDQIAERSALMGWLRGDPDWDPAEFRRALELVAGADFDPCAPGCAHERAPAIAYRAARILDRTVLHSGDRDAAILIGEALELGNEMEFRVRAGDLVLTLVLQELGWQPELSE